MKGKLLLGITGMPGAGKAIVSNLMQKMGYTRVVMGDVVRDEVKNRGLKPTPKNLGYIMIKLREEEGPHIVAERCIPKISKARGKIVIVDGVRSLYEVKVFQKYFTNFKLIALHASPDTRFKRLFRRKRSDDPKGWDAFAKRDLRELNIGLGDVIALADYMIVNEGTKNQLKRRTCKVLEKVIAG